MDRRKSLKLIATGAVGIPTIFSACRNEDKPGTLAVPANESPAEFPIERYPDELAYEKKVQALDKFFTDKEMESITILGDIIIPKDDVSGSASDAKVPEFIEFIVKDEPQNQVPLRGGLRWLDMQCLQRFGKDFTASTQAERILLIDDIAYPAKARPEMTQGVAFFNRFRDLVATGFYSTEMGWKDIGYAGNTPNQWAGVPADVLKQYNLAYTQKELAETV